MEAVSDDDMAEIPILGRVAAGQPILDLKRPGNLSNGMQRRLLDTLQEYNVEHQAQRGDSNLAARISSYELAFAMQRHAPETVDLARETEATRRLYGLNEPRTRDFGVSQKFRHRRARGDKLQLAHDGDERGAV